jgi:hypothetical protein
MDIGYDSTISPLSKESFCQEVSNDPTVQILAGWEGNPTTSVP